MATNNCICIKYGTLYGPEYVNRLGDALRRHSTADVRFLCLTDDSTGIDASVEIVPLTEEPFAERLQTALAKAPRQGAMKKVSMFRRDLIPDLDGPLMAFDLDVAIVGSIDALRDYAPGKVCMRREFQASRRCPSLGHGSVERFDPALHGYLYEDFAADPEGVIAKYNGSEQAYTSARAMDHGDLEFYPDEWIVSFKYHCRPTRPLNLLIEPKLPDGAKVVCFHGLPKMEDAIGGYSAGPFKSTRPCGWLKEAWYGPGH